jgi:hypothetical protein
MVIPPAKSRSPILGGLSSPFPLHGCDSGGVHERPPITMQ